MPTDLESSDRTQSGTHEGHWCQEGMGNYPVTWRGVAGLA